MSFVRIWAGRLALASAAMTVSVIALHPAPALAQSTPTVTLPDFSELADRVGPSVVNIRTTERRATAERQGGGMDPNMEEFFRRFGIPIPNQPNPRGGPRGGDEEPQQRGVGSGFVLSADGFIMTNAHVVDGADEVIVTLTDKREFKAKIIGADRRSDVAVVKIEATGLPPVKLGDVNRLKVGEWVMAHRHRRHRQRQAARHRRPAAADPDRRRHQPRQQRRPAAEPARRGRGHQLADLQPQRRLHGHQLCHSHRRSAACG